MLKNLLYFTLIGILLSISGCSTHRSVTLPSKKFPSQNLDTAPSGLTKKNGEPVATMRPYSVFGKEYYPTIVSVGDTFEGRASWYGPEFHGKSTSNGEGYDMYAMSAAHKTLPMNTVVRVRNNDNGKVCVVRINDRGPFVENRIIDLSYAAATSIGLTGKGSADVMLEVLGFEPTGLKTIDYLAMKKGPRSEILTSFAVQIGAFSNPSGALNTQKKYANFQGYSAIINDSLYNNDKLLRVWLRGFRSEAEARDFIAKGYFSGQFITREN